MKGLLAVSRGTHWCGSAPRGSPPAPAAGAVPSRLPALHGSSQLPTRLQPLITISTQHTLFHRIKKMGEKNVVGRAGRILCILLPDRRFLRCAQDWPFSSLNLRLQEHKNSWGNNKSGWRPKNISTPCSEEQQKRWDKQLSTFRRCSITKASASAAFSMRRPELQFTAFFQLCALIFHFTFLYAPNSTRLRHKQRSWNVYGVPKK